MRIGAVGLVARLHDDDQRLPVLRRVRVSEATLDRFVGNTAAANNIPRNSNFVHGTTPVRSDNAAILNYWVEISKTGEKARWNSCRAERGGSAG